MTAPECRLCPLPLDFAATANGLDVCTTCALQALRASRTGTRAVVVSRAEVAPAVTDEWQVFLDAVNRAAVDGVVHANDIRPLIRGRIFHKHIGQIYREAKRRGVLVPLGREESKDSAGRNTHHDSGVFRVGINANEVAA